MQTDDSCPRAASFTNRTSRNRIGLSSQRYTYSPICYIPIGLNGRSRIHGYYMPVGREHALAHCQVFVETQSQLLKSDDSWTQAINLFNTRMRRYTVFSFSRGVEYIRWCRYHSSSQVVFHISGYLVIHPAHSFSSSIRKICGPSTFRWPLFPQICSCRLSLSR
jgi:hypothetical protein